MRNEIRCGSGKVVVHSGVRGKTPALVICSVDEEHPVGDLFDLDVGGVITEEELDERGATIILFPDYKGVDVILNAVMTLWQEKKAEEWDGIDREKR